MMNLLKEMKGVQHTLAQTVYYGFQAFLKSEDSPTHLQPTLPSMFQRQARSEATRGGGGVHEEIEIMTRKVGTTRIVFMFVFQGFLPVVL